MIEHRWWGGDDCVEGGPVVGPTPMTEHRRRLRGFRFR